MMKRSHRCDLILTKQSFFPGNFSSRFLSISNEFSERKFPENNKCWVGKKLFDEKIIELRSLTREKVKKKKNEITCKY